MPGFFITNRKEAYSLSELDQDFDFLHEKIETKDFLVERNTLKKFLDDKVFHQDDKYIFIIEGVIYNKLDLLNMYECHNFFDTLKVMYQKNGETYFKDFRGSFSGACYDKEKKKWILFTNQIGDHPIYYSYDSKGYLFSTSVEYIAKFKRKAYDRITLNESACYDLMTYGFMGSYEGTNTIINEIHRLTAGKYLTYENGEFTIQTYHRFTTEGQASYCDTEEQAMNELDRLFRQAVKREFDKDQEYGYQHLASLSGGLDSRMVNWVAKDLGYKNILNMTFSQTGYLDETISEEISSYLGNEYLFKSLDDAKFLTEDEFLMCYASSACTYNLLAHSNSMLKYMNFKKLGSLHTGQLGDVVIGTFIKDGTDENTGFYSKRLLNKIKRVDNTNDKEIELMYKRGFLGAAASHILIQNYTEVASPFIDLDLFEYCLSIPASFRKNHSLYKKWIITKYPDAADFIWEKNYSKIGASKFVSLINRARMKGFKNCLIFILKKFNHNIVLKDDKKNMNPFNYWYHHNDEFRNHIDSLRNNTENLTVASADLIHDIECLFDQGDTLEKCMAVSVISAIQHYFNN